MRLQIFLILKYYIFWLKTYLLDFIVGFFEEAKYSFTNYKVNLVGLALIFCVKNYV